MKKLIFSALLSLLVITSANAFNMSFLSYSPAYYFTAQDWKIMKGTADNVLSHGRDNVQVTWSNPKTGANGIFTPYSKFSQNGTICRKMKIFNEAHNQTGEATYLFCSIRNEWKLS